MKKLSLAKDDIAGILEKVRKALESGESTTISTDKYLRVPAKGKPCTIEITPWAYAKVRALVDDFSVEVAWHFLCERSGDRSFLISDVIVYPQTITATNVDTDEQELAKWLMSLDDETFSKMRGQGHSHVNMGVTPSGTDENLYKELFSQIGADDFYIFCIANKKNDFYWRIYDRRDGVIYEDFDVEMKLGSSIGEFLKDAHEKAQREKPKTYPYTYAPKAKKPNKKSDKKPDKKSDTNRTVFSDDWGDLSDMDNYGWNGYEYGYYGRYNYGI